MITINGQFTARRVTGQERFAFEIISELDKYTSCQIWEGERIFMGTNFFSFVYANSS